MVGHPFEKTIICRNTAEVPLELLKELGLTIPCSGLVGVQWLAFVLLEFSFRPSHRGLQIIRQPNRERGTALFTHTSNKPAFHE